MSVKTHIDYISAFGTIEEYLQELERKESDTYVTDLKNIEAWFDKQKININRILQDKYKKTKDTSGEVEMQKEESYLIIDENLKIKRFEGAFTLFMGNVDLAKDKMLISDIICDSSQVDNFRSLIAFASQHKHVYSFTAVLKSRTGISYKTILKISPYKNDLFHVELDYIEFAKIKLYPAYEYRTFMLENIPGVKVYLYDEECRILEVGSSKEEYKLKDVQSIKGKKIFEAFEESYATKIYPFFKKSLKGEYSEGFIRVNHVLLVVNSIPVSFLNGKCATGMTVVRDTQDIKNVQHGFDAKGIELFSEKQSKFVADLAHEFRTPLNGIVGFSQLLQRTGLNEKQERYNQLVLKMSDQLLHLVDEVMYLSKIGEKKISIEKTNFKIEELLNEFHLQFSVQASEKAINFSIDSDFKQPSELIGDLFHLKQILMNLLTNAFKYTKSGSVKLSCDILDQIDDEVMLRFRVKDTGIGIADEELPYVFEAFQQASNGCVKSENSAGLGLAISKKLTTMLGGEISVESQLNEGSEFTVILPFTIPPK